MAGDGPAGERTCLLTHLEGGGLAVGVLVPVLGAEAQEGARANMRETRPGRRRRWTVPSSVPELSRLAVSLEAQLYLHTVRLPAWRAGPADVAPETETQCEKKDAAPSGLQLMRRVQLRESRLAQAQAGGCGSHSTHLRQWSRYERGAGAAHAALGHGGTALHAVDCLLAPTRRRVAQARRRLTVRRSVSVLRRLCPSSGELPAFCYRNDRFLHF